MKNGFRVVKKRNAVNPLAVLLQDAITSLEAQAVQDRELADALEWYAADPTNRAVDPEAATAHAARLRKRTEALMVDVARTLAGTKEE